MGFKKLNTPTHLNLNEEVFLNATRGETSQIHSNYPLKRSKKLLINLTSDEFEQLSKEAIKLGLSKNSYVRLRIFNQ